MGYPPQAGVPPARSDRRGTQGGVPPSRGNPARSNGCYPRWGTPTGVPPPKVGYPQQGYHPGGVPQPGPTGGTWGGVPPSRAPPARSDRGYLRWGTPRQEYPPARSDSRVPKVGSPTRGTPTWTWLGYPPSSGPGRGTPPLGVDRQTDRWMDRHVSKHNLLSYYAVGKNDIASFISSNTLPETFGIFRIVKRHNALFKKMKFYCTTAQGMARLMWHHLTEKWVLCQIGWTTSVYLKIKQFCVLTLPGLSNEITF